MGGGVDGGNSEDATDQTKQAMVNIAKQEKGAHEL
jgi:hypothetical protein